MYCPPLFIVLLVVLAGCAGTRPTDATRSTDVPRPTEAAHPTAGTAPDPLAPGDPRLDLAAVSVPSSRTFTLSVLRGGEPQPIGTLTETVRRTADGGISRVHRLQSPRGLQIDSLTASADLAPRSHDSYNPGRTVSLTYGARTATGTYTATGSAPVAVNDALLSPAFDSNFIDLVARAVPLEGGFTSDVRTYERASADATATEVTYTVRVVGREAVGGQEAVVVEFGKADGGKTRLYVDPVTRAMIRHESEVGPGLTLLITPS